jgi:hypothetical protein
MPKHQLEAFGGSPPFFSTETGTSHGYITSLTLYFDIACSDFMREICGNSDISHNFFYGISSGNQTWLAEKHPIEFDDFSHLEACPVGFASHA